MINADEARKATAARKEIKDKAMVEKALAEIYDFMQVAMTEGNYSVEIKLSPKMAFLYCRDRTITELVNLGYTVRNCYNEDEDDSIYVSWHP